MFHGLYKGIAAIALLLFLNFCHTNARDWDCSRTTQEMATRRGFYADNHTIQTDDGYLVLTYRVFKKGVTSFRGHPILMAHGLMGSSDNQVDNGEKSLPYHYANLSYDVWLMNLRGNKYSRKHIKLNPNTSSDFWDFTFHEIGIYDIKANINYIMKKTNQTKVNFCCYSVSCAALFAAIDQDPAYYNAHLQSILMHAPAIYMEHSNILMALAYSTLAFQAMNFFGIRELFQYDRDTASFSEVFCDLNPAVCNIVLGIITDMDPSVDNQERYEVVLSHYPVGASTGTFLHLLELKSHKAFIKHRPTFFHPIIPYNLSALSASVPVALMTGTKDRLVKPEDGLECAKAMNKTGGVKFYKEYKNNGHITWILPALIAKQFVTDSVEFIKKYD